MLRLWLVCRNGQLQNIMSSNIHIFGASTAAHGSTSASVRNTNTEDEEDNMLSALGLKRQVQYGALVDNVYKEFCHKEPMTVYFYNE